MIKKQLKTIIILAIAAIVLLAAYLLLKPVLFPSESTDIERAEYDKDGDRLGNSDRPYIYDVIDRTEIATIAVHSEKSDFSLRYDSVAGDFVLDGFEMLTLDEEKAAYLYVNTCNMLAMTKVENPSQDLSEYGLADGVSENYFTVKKLDGSENTVYVGNLLPTGAAFYCKSADKPHIYVIDTMVSDYVFIDPNSLILPMLAPPIDMQARYNIQDVKIIRDGELFVAFENITDEGEKEDYSISHRIVHPEGYMTNQEYLDTILSKLCSFVGTQVVEYNIPEENMQEILGKYGLVSPSCEIIYTLDGKEYRVVFGSKTEDASAVYALNLSQRIICEVPLADVPFVESDFIKFVDNYFFQMDIDNVQSIRVTSKMHDETFLLSGADDALSAKRASNGEAVDIESFKQFYIDILLMKLEDYASTPEVPAEILSYTITSKNGSVFEYRFYDLSTRKVFFTSNGVGKFYCNRDIVDNIIENLAKLLRGEKVVSSVLK